MIGLYTFFLFENIGCVIETLYVLAYSNNKCDFVKHTFIAYK